MVPIGFFADTQRGLRMVTDPVGTVVIVTDTGDTAPLPPPPDQPRRRGARTPGSLFPSAPTTRRRRSHAAQ